MPVGTFPNLVPVKVAVSVTYWPAGTTERLDWTEVVVEEGV